MEEKELTGNASPSQSLEGHLKATKEGDPCSKHKRNKELATTLHKTCTMCVRVFTSESLFVLLFFIRLLRCHVSVPQSHSTIRKIILETSRICLIIEVRCLF